MGKDSKIEWTHHTFNPWWGCTKVSDGCKNCYAEGFAKRTGHAVWGDAAPRRFFGDKHWDEPLKWNSEAEKAGERRRVFCASMADVFEKRDDLEESRKRLQTLISYTQHLDWLLLTKRPENIEDLWPVPFFGSNIWLGTSAEDQPNWDRRVHILMQIPATVHFVSMEPMLGPIDMGAGPLPEWIICGGESGPRTRPVVPEWVHSIQRQSVNRTAFFFKQWGGRDKKAAGRRLNNRHYDELPRVATT